MKSSKSIRIIAATLSAVLLSGLLSAPAFAQTATPAVAGVALDFMPSIIAEAEETKASAQITEAPLTSALTLANMALGLNGKGDAEEIKAAEQQEIHAPKTEWDGTEHPAVLAVEARREAAEKSIYNTLAISNVENFVNIRTAPDKEAEVVGKIFNNAAANILETIEAEDGTWYRICSGSVDGYIKAEYFVTGAEAAKLAAEVGYVTAAINVQTLRLRERSDLGSPTVSVLTQGETYTVVEQGEEFSRIEIDSDISGYVQNDYIDVTVSYKEAMSLEEEAAMIAEAERLAREAAEAEAKLRAAEKAKAAEKSKAAEKAKKKSTTASETTTEKRTYPDDNYQDTTTAKKTTAEWRDNGSSELRDAIVAFASQYVGVLKYVWGGTSLETGADCSGFVQQVFKHFGIKLPRCSDDQGYAGKAVNSEDMRPGDIVYYGGHISIYIGNGLVVHASSANSNPNTKISQWNYRQVLGIRNVIGD